MSDTPQNDTFARIIAEVEARCGGNKDMMIGMLAQRVVTLRAALQPFALIAYEWQINGLDESRPSWGHSKTKAAEIEILGGRGGKCLLTIGDAFAAHAAITGQP